MSEQTDCQNNRSLELCKRVVTTESFIAEAKEIYGDRYDYSKVDYKNREHRVTIVCPVHGDFQVYAREHLDGKGCPKCEKGDKFISKLKEKFGDKFGLEQFVYESSTTPVTLICPTHGAFSKLPHGILGSRFGCPECGNEEQRKQQEKLHNEAVAKKEEKRKAREELEAQRLNEWLNEREEQRKKRERALKAFQAGKKSRDFYSPFQIYQQIVDEHIDDIRYNAKWREPYCTPYRLTEDEARKLTCYREGDTFYRYSNEAPDDFFRKAFERDYSYYGGTFEEYLSHRSCIIIFYGNDLIIQEESYEHDLERHGQAFISQKKEESVSIPSSFVSIDFETLYSQRVSACSVGMVKYKDGEITDRYYSLIRPPFDYPGKSGKELTWVHGISKEMLLNEKTFAELLPEMETFVDGLPLVAHNASVEKCCIRDACAYYGVETQLDYDNILDTLPLSRQAENKLGLKVEGQGTHSLDVVCTRFGVAVKNHHNALEDAEMCGNLMAVFHEILTNGKTLQKLEEEKESKESIADNLKQSIDSEKAKVNAVNINGPKNRGCLGLLILVVLFASFIFSI